MGRVEEEWPEIDWETSEKRWVELTKKYARQDAKEKKRMVVQGAGVKNLVRLKQKRSML